MPAGPMLIVAMLVLAACQQSTVENQAPLVEPEPVATVEAPEADGACRIEVSEQRMCIMVYQPVCGCDGKTYSNGCMAGNAGITRMTEGECAEDGPSMK